MGSRDRVHFADAKPPDASRRFLVQPLPRPATSLSNHVHRRPFPSVWSCLVWRRWQNKYGNKRIIVPSVWSYLPFENRPLSKFRLLHIHVSAGSQRCRPTLQRCYKQWSELLQTLWQFAGWSAWLNEQKLMWWNHSLCPWGNGPWVLWVKPLLPWGHPKTPWKPLRWVHLRARIVTWWNRSLCPWGNGPWVMWVKPLLPWGHPKTPRRPLLWLHLRARIVMWWNHSLCPWGNGPWVMWVKPLLLWGYPRTPRKPLLWVQQLFRSII